MASHGSQHQSRESQALDGFHRRVRGPSGQHLYRLKFPEEFGRPAKDIEFEAEDAGEALIFAHREARKRSAELWEDGRKLCSIRRTEEEMWEIFPNR